jgi:hypothetical protein
MLFKGRPALAIGPASGSFSAAAWVGTCTLKEEKIWVQDNQRLAPYGLGSAWVSNTFHHYCLQFRNK